MAEQMTEFTKGFEQELDFNHEAEIQERFFNRSLMSDRWYVPKVYGGTGRVIEMEYLEDADASLCRRIYLAGGHRGRRTAGRSGRFSGSASG